MIIKNIEHKKVLKYIDEVSILPGQIVSKTLVQNKAVSLTLFAFDKDTEISTHDSTGDALVHVLEGEGTFTIDNIPYVVKQGESIVMPAAIPHSVYASEKFKMLLTVVF